MNPDFKDAVETLKKATAADKKYTKEKSKDDRLVAIALFEEAEVKILKVLASKCEFAKP